MTTETRNPSGHADTQGGTAEELKHDAHRVMDSVGARTKDEAEGLKGEAAHMTQSASSALGTAADDLRANPDAPDWMASALQQAARRIESVAHHVEGRSIDQLGQDAAAFARRNPGTFLAASAAAGFAAARVLRAGADRKRHEGEQTNGSRNDRQPRSQGGSHGAREWPADENMTPTETGSFEPAYADSANRGGAAR